MPKRECILHPWSSKEAALSSVDCPSVELEKSATAAKRADLGRIGRSSVCKVAFTSPLARGGIPSLALMIVPKGSRWEPSRHAAKVVLLRSTHLFCRLLLVWT